MSGSAYTGQTAWEETEEEYQARCNKAQSNKESWMGTAIGIAAGILALIALFEQL